MEFFLYIRNEFENITGLMLNSKMNVLIMNDFFEISPN